MVLEAQCVPPAGCTEPTGDPRVVAQRLIVKSGSLEDQTVTIRVSFLTVYEPVTDPPSGRVRDKKYLLANSLPDPDWQAIGQVKRSTAGASDCI